MQFEPLPPQHEPEEPDKPGCLFRAVVGIVILALLASSLISIAWFVRRDNDSTISSAEITPATAEPSQPSTKQPTPQNITSVDPANPSSAPPSSTDAINRIVIVNNLGHVETMAPDGADRRALTGEEFTYQFPAWSPDGSRIAALGDSDEGSGIFLLEDDESTPDPQELVFGRGNSPFYLYWSPDSSQISYLSAQIGREMSLNIVDTTAEPESRTIASGSPFYWHWSDAGNELLIHSGGASDDARLALIDDAGEDQIPEITSPGYFQAPGISPSGRYWAYSQIQSGGNSWLTIDDRQNGETLTERHAGTMALSWSPTEDKLAYISGSERSEGSFWGPLRMIDAQTGDVSILSSNLVLAFFWSPDGQKIATISLPFDFGLDGGVEVRDTKSGRLAKRSFSTLVQRNPHAFNLAIIDVTDGSGIDIGEVSFPTYYLTQFLVFFDQYALSHRIWSPDSAALVMPLLDNSEVDITVVNAESGRETKIGPGRIAFWSPR